MPALDGPNYTQAPNELLDAVLPEIDSLAELKITFAIVRQTFGWHRDRKPLSISRLMTLTGMGRKAVVDGTRRAVERGYVVQHATGDKRCPNAYSLRVGSSSIEPAGVSQSNQQSLPELVRSSNSEKEKVNTEKKTPVDRVIEHWQQVLAPNSKGTQGRRRKVAARLAEFPVEDVLKAIDNCAASKWHRDNGHTDLTLICRSPEKLEQFRDMPAARTNGSQSAGGIANIRRTDTDYAAHEERAQTVDDDTTTRGSDDRD